MYKTENTLPRVLAPYLLSALPFDSKLSLIDGIPARGSINRFVKSALPSQGNICQDLSSLHNSMNHTW